VAKQTPNIKTDPTNQMQRRFAPRSHKTSIGSLASPRLSEPHSSSFDHSLNIITEATDSAAFANITCGIQGLSLSPPAPVEPQLHLLWVGNAEIVLRLRDIPVESFEWLCDI